MKYILFILISLLFSNDDYINAQLLYEEGLYSDAKNLVETIDSKNEDVSYLSYQIYFKLDDLNKANEYLQKAIQLNEDEYIEEGDKLGLFINELKNAKVTLDNGFINEAIEELTALLEKYPKSGIIYYRLGYAYKEKNDYDQAALNFKKAIKFNPFENNYKESITTLVKIQESNGKEEYTRQDYQAALTYFNKALSFDSTYAPVMYRIGNIYYKIKDYEQAINYYKQGISYSDLAPNKYKYVNQLGKFYTKINNLDKAIENFDYVLELKPGYVPALFEKSKIFKTKGLSEKSKLLLLQITNTDPSYVAAYELLMDLEKDSKNYDKAISYGEMCLDFNSESASVNSRMANVYNEMLNFDKARFYAKESLKIDKRYAPALFELGYSEMSLCNKVAAKDAFSKSKSDKRFRKISNDYLKNLDLYTKDCKN